MNTFLLSLMDKRIEGLITRFSAIPMYSTLLCSSQTEILVKKIKRLLDTYICFLQIVGIAPAKSQYSENTLMKRVSFFPVDHHHPDDIEKKLIKLTSLPLIPSLIPVNIHISEADEISLYTGIGIADTKDSAISFFLHELSISTDLIKYTRLYLHYLDELLAGYNPTDIHSLRELAAGYHKKNYNGFQSDCREYFGDTFHQFYNKLKMLDALEDIMLTEFSLKEIAAKNHFSNYNSMYTCFRKKYKFPIDSIPRLLTET